MFFLKWKKSCLHFNFWISTRFSCKKLRDYRAVMLTMLSVWARFLVWTAMFRASVYINQISVPEQTDLSFMWELKCAGASVFFWDRLLHKLHSLSRIFCFFNFFNWFSDSSADPVNETVNNTIIHHVANFSKPCHIMCFWQVTEHLSCSHNLYNLTSNVRTDAEDVAQVCNFPSGIHPAVSKELQHKSWDQLKLRDTYIAQGWYGKDMG